MARSVIACRISSYGPFEPAALDHLASLGVRHVEIAVPASDKLEQAGSQLESLGLSATSMHGRCDVQRADIGPQVEEQMPAFEALDTPLMFVSVKTAGLPLETVYARLRAAGDVAGRHGVTIVLETHPDLVTNAAVALQTMQGVNHPHVRINFDTANVYFYNRGMDAVGELRTLLPFVSSLHLKDTDGGFEHWCFPALGRGIVNFREIFQLLDEAGFAGPCTLEIEGIAGETKTERLVCDRVAESIGYLRALGRM